MLRGVSTSAYARREGLALGLLYLWRRKLSSSDDLRKSQTISLQVLLRCG